MGSIPSWFPPSLFLGPSVFLRLRFPALFQLALLLLSPISPYQLLLATSKHGGGGGTGEWLGLIHLCG